jgi:zinc protease
LCEQITTPTYPRIQVERQKRRLLDRLKVEKDDPRTQGGLLFRKLVYGDHWLGRAAYGTIESVEKIGPAQLRAHHAKNWVAKRAIIAVCGDVEPKKVARTLDKLLAHFHPGTALATTPPKFPDRGIAPACSRRNASRCTCTSATWASRATIRTIPRSS